MKNRISFLRKSIYRVILFYRMSDVSSAAGQEEVWYAIEDGINKKEKRRRVIMLSLITSAAAIITGCIFLFNLRKSLPQPEEIVNISQIAQQLPNDSVSEEIQLYVSPKDVVTVDKGSTVTYTDEGIHVDGNQIAENKPSSLIDEYNKIVVPKGKYTKLILSDGTSMFVNAGTSVTYPKQFAKNVREIFVDGEVYLDVAHNENCPFVVKTTDFEVNVLGTAFDVNAYSHSIESSEVVLVRGKVRVMSNLGNEVVLSPNQKAKIHRSGEIKNSTVKADDYILWTQGIMNLGIAPLRDILLRLSRYYGVNITCSQGISDIEIAGKIDLACSVDEALKRVSDTGRFSVSKLGDNYYLKQK
ncbi:FecR family protein [Phocaeicola sp.]|uniref:FecR family protein n=2 Tax=Phocaeicola sp. TaxID=2773926 RepID=UPI003F9F7C6C